MQREYQTFNYGNIFFKRTKFKFSCLARIYSTPTGYIGFTPQQRFLITNGDFCRSSLLLQRPNYLFGPYALDAVTWLFIRRTDGLPQLWHCRRGKLYFSIFFSTLKLEPCIRGCSPKFLRNFSPPSILLVWIICFCWTTCPP